MSINSVKFRVISPCDANTMAKLANGMCDNLVTCVARAWDTSTKPLLIFPAMNTFMWNHPVTEKHCNIIKSYPNHHIFQPIAKKLACGDVGIGAMASTDSIVTEILYFKEK